MALVLISSQSISLLIKYSFIPVINKVVSSNSCCSFDSDDSLVPSYSNTTVVNFFSIISLCHLELIELPIASSICATLFQNVFSNVADSIAQWVSTSVLAFSTRCAISSHVSFNLFSSRGYFCLIEFKISIRFSLDSANLFSNINFCWSTACAFLLLWLSNTLAGADLLIRICRLKSYQLVSNISLVDALTLAMFSLQAFRIYALDSNANVKSCMLVDPV